MNHNLTAYIKRYIDISLDGDAHFQSYLKIKELGKKEYLLQEGNLCTSRYFVTRGCLRLYYIDPKGNEQIIHFGIENWWITDYDSLINNTPSRIYIQAIEPTEVLELRESDLAEIYRKVPGTERLFRIVMERTYIAIQKRMEYMFSLSSEEMYRTFIKANPKFVQRVPQYMLASYLGITPEYLSALRKEH